MTPTVIGLTGRAGAGKDTLAADLAAYGYRRVAFADPLKRAAYDTNPRVDTGSGSWSVQYLVDRLGWDGAKRYPEVREYLQRFGVAMRDAVPGVWLAAAQHSIEAALAAGESVVVTDVRFEDEARMIRGLGGLVARVTRPGVAPVSDHVSETNVDAMRVDVELLNDGPLYAVRDVAARLHELARLKTLTEAM